MAAVFYVSARLVRPILALFFCTVYLVIEGPVVTSAQSLSSIVGGLSATPTRRAPRSSFWNPALIASSKVHQLDANIALMGGWMIYDRSGVDPNTSKGYSSSSLSAMAPNPYFSVGTTLGFKSLSFGYSTYFPGGIFADFDDRGSQRYQLIEGLSLPWHHQVTVVYRPTNQWAIGLSGIYSVGFQKAELSLDLNRFVQRVLKSDLVPAENKSLEAKARIPLSTTHAFGGALGIHYAPAYQWAFGLAIFSPIHYVYDTHLTIQTPSSLPTLGASLKALGVEDTLDLKIKADLWLPPIINFGVLYQPFGYWTSEIFLRYALTSLYPSVAITVTDAPIVQARTYKRKGEQLNDHFLLGTVQSFQLWNNSKLGLHLDYSSSAVPSNRASVSLIDFDSLLVGSFFEYELSGKTTIGCEYSHSFLFDRFVSGSANGGSENDFFPAASSDGQYRAGSDRVALMVNYAF